MDRNINRMGRPTISANKLLRHATTQTPEVNWRIRQLRMKVTPRMTQGDLAERLRISVESVKAIEQGRAAPTIKTLRLVKRLFKVTWEYLMEA